MRARITLVAALATVALTAAGCGGGSTGAGASALGGAAAVAPADAAAFVALDTDLSSAQWNAADALLAKLPGREALLSQLLKSFQQQTKLSWTADVEPALGAELDAVVLPAAADGTPQTVVLVQPGDAKALDALVAKLAQAGTTVHTKEIGGWTGLSESAAALDAVAGATAHLADDATYREATGKLAGGALLRAYANGASAKQLLAALGETAPAAGKGTLVWGSADVVAESGGLRANGYLRTEGAPAETPYASTLVDRIPAGALVVADFAASPRTGQEAPPAPGAGTLPKQLEPLVAPLRKVAATLGGETALYVSPGLPIPSVTLVTTSSDPQATLAALRETLAAVGSALSGSSGGGSGAAPGGLDLGSILGSLTLAHEVVGGDLVVSTSSQAIDAFKGTGQKLAGDGTFEEARSVSGMPAKTTGFLYVNLKDALPAVQGLATLAGLKLPAPLTGDLSALRTLTAYGTGAAGESSFTVFLGMS